MEKMEFTAKTVEEALARACAELGAPSTDALTYTVLEEPKRGLFGLGAQPARVQASYAAPAAEPTPAPAAAPAAEAKADPALDFIQTLIRNMELDVKVTMTEPAAGEKYISIEGDAAGVLIGHHGDTLDSLQYLVNLAANKKETDERKYTRISIDIENYREKREETLKKLARHMAEKAKKITLH